MTNANYNYEQQQQQQIVTHWDGAHNTRWDVRKVHRMIWQRALALCLNCCGNKPLRMLIKFDKVKGKKGTSLS